VSTENRDIMMFYFHRHYCFQTNQNILFANVDLKA